MGRQVAIAVFPFHGRLGACAAIPTRFDLVGSVAAFAGLNDFVAYATIVIASFGGHKGTLTAFANGLTNHGNHPPL